MGYLIFQILFFLLLAALLGFVIGWLLRGSRFQSELKDLDGRWRAKLGEVESERDRFAGEVTQANEARAKAEAAEADAKRLAETHDSSLQQLRREHQTKLGLLSDTEQRAGGLEKELAEAKASLAERQASGGDADRLGRDLAAATTRASELERDLATAKEANAACRSEVVRLQARVADLENAPVGSTSIESASGGGALGLVGGTDTVQAADRDDSGSAAGGGDSAGWGGQSGSGDGQPAAAPASSADTDGQSFAGGNADALSAGDDSGGEGVRPEALPGPRGGTADDLKKISGVGPKLERTLNDLGIYHFSQIAEFTPEHVAWVDKYLRFKGRIARENWIEQAKILAAGGETDFSRRY
ncbi:MAG: hypothetical protein R3F54_14725 [Alphaproteobacteria bacterium]